MRLAPLFHHPTGLGRPAVGPIHIRLHGPRQLHVPPPPTVRSNQSNQTNQLRSAPKTPASHRCYIPLPESTSIRALRDAWRRTKTYNAPSPPSQGRAVTNANT